jgi:hypothetical protein
MNLISKQKIMTANLKIVGSTFRSESNQPTSPVRQTNMAPGLDERYGAATPFSQRPNAKRPLPEWKSVQVLPPLQNSAAPPVKSIWLAPERETFSEKLVFALITAAALATVVYGFSSIVDLLQHWAVFQAGLTHFLS